MVMELLTSHASVRKYKDVSLSSEEVRELVLAGQHAASSHFVQAYSVIHVTDPVKRAQLVELANNKNQFLSAGAILIFCVDYARLEKAAALHGKTIDYSFAENLLVGSIDVALFAQNVAIAAESKGYGICYIGGIRNAPQEISDLLNLPKGVAPMFAMSIGVPDEANEVKPRLPVEAVIHENSYDASKYDDLLPAYDQTMHDYYLNRGSNQKDTAWSEQMAQFLHEPKRKHMKEFLEKRGFEMK
ncbi:oxygen-insensitive NADPH nitroreductase [Sporosarcina sp. Te-1]|uniref:oxygen-insensitive NADPH nitroreductase n=1 Tax=Sporosarcina sp. Te-1 TaxID=2818390 RepID=UPI001A9FA7A7|nr:oxygen-insensitive NADPH nitroreductase [Sporosarcina sp. Te-1]QTD39656.1 oxygen-insensitive NADPH nitroreductase [Sporosarcina sp. Te-1]